MPCYQTRAIRAVPKHLGTLDSELFREQDTVCNYIPYLRCKSPKISGLKNAILGLFIYFEYPIWLNLSLKERKGLIWYLNSK